MDDSDDWQTRVDAFWQAFDHDAPEPMLARMRELVGERPADDALALAEWGGVNDSLGFEETAVEAYRRALGDAPAVFLALALHSAGRPDEALRTALTALAAHLPRYRRAATAYAADLTPASPPAS